MPRSSSRSRSLLVPLLGAALASPAPAAEVAVDRVVAGSISLEGPLGIGRMTDEVSPGTALDAVGAIATDDQLISRAPDGIAPLMVASSTRVDLLNADLLDGVDAAELSRLGESIDSSEIDDGTLVDADVAAAAAISGSKIEPRFGDQTVSTTDRLGVGTESPATRLHVVGGDVLLDGGGYNFTPPGGGAADLALFRGGTADDGLFVAKRFAPDHTVFQINSPPDSLGALEATLALVRGDEPDVELLDLYNNGYPSETQFGIRVQSRGAGELRDFVFDYWDGVGPKVEVYRIRPDPSIVFRTDVGIGTDTPMGALDVNGPIYQRGVALHADYVFEPDYPMPTIEQHARAMWSERHLPAVPPRRQDDDGVEIVDVGAQRRGLLEELEIAHVFVEQLHHRVGELERERDELRRRLEALEARWPRP